MKIVEFQQIIEFTLSNGSSYKLYFKSDNVSIRDSVIKKKEEVINKCKDFYLNHYNSVASPIEMIEYISSLDGIISYEVKYNGYDFQISIK